MVALLQQDTTSPPNVILVLGSDHFDPPTPRGRRQHQHSSLSSTTSSSLTPPSTPSKEQKQQGEEQRTRWPCHKHILSKYSKYFETMFTCDFEESGATIIFMPRGIFGSSRTLDSILHYMYHSTLDDNVKKEEDQDTDTAYFSSSDDGDTTNTTTTLDDILEQLTRYQDLYAAADYLGMAELCIHLADKLMELAHHCTCYCDTCAYVVPSLFAFSQPRAQNQDDPSMMKLTEAALTIMTFDPEKALVSFWACPSMIDVLWSLYCSPHNDYAPPSLDNPLTQSLLNHISKTSAIESLHGCYIGTRPLMALDDEHDVILHATFKAARTKATKTIATHFDFYCSKYPTLLSCIDGVIYSSSFLEYLLMRTIHDQMTPENAGTLYHGVVRHLMARHAVQHSAHLKKIFGTIKEEIIHYIFYHAKEIRECGSLASLDDHLLTCLVQDVALPLDRLLKTADSHHLSPSQHHQHQHLQQNQLQKQSWTRFLMKKKHTNKHHHTQVYNIPKLDEFNEKKYNNNNDDDDDDDYLQDEDEEPPQPRTTTPLNRKPWSLKTWMLRWNKTYQMEIHTVAVGRRVELIHRPVLTTGTVAFVGHVTFADGIWVGVELDRRVGKSDGSVDGQRYFTTSPSRGEFVRINQVGVLLD
ncbi:hypothetical protein BC941DRAFT_420014 [Chlamydoabsidia padenii]|nr:hypothetical protein BC941DRAFT_420014 [Chlamydoabsidia padenii]